MEADKSRLDDIHPARRTREVLFVGGGDEMFELFKVHSWRPREID